MLLRVTLLLVVMVVPSASRAQSTACSASRPWTVQPKPILTIGELEGAPEYLFSRVPGLLTLRDSTIVIANGNPRELRHYTYKGRHLFSFGRTGEGPGEFRTILGVIRLPGDSLLVHDMMQMRTLPLFSSQGKYLRNVPVSVGAANVLRMYHLAESKLVLVTGTGLRIGEGRDSLAVFIHDLASSKTARLGTFAGMDQNIQPTERGTRTKMIRYARGLASAAGSGHIFLADTEKEQIRVFDAEGRLLRSFGSGRLGALVTADDKKVYLTRDPNATFRANKPFFGDFLVDLQGNLWAQHYQRPNLHAPHNWDIYDSRGNRLCSVITPADHKLYEIGRDYILAVSTDEFGVERVVKLALRK
ncbi:MAG: hypothetical protein ACRERX_22610 [Pseudomonas sp.]